MNNWQQIRSRWPGLLAITLLLIIYAWTLQRNVNGSSHDYLLDTGEIQVALNLWGTIHYTGYPHYTILSAGLTQIGKLLGMAPAAAASFPSLVWSLLGLFLFYHILRHITKENDLLTSLVIVTIGLVETFWLHSIIAEVYSFSFLLISSAVLLSLRLTHDWQEREWWLLGLVAGTAVAHHHILVITLPTLAILLWPHWWIRFKQSPAKFFTLSLFVFFAPFLAYLYLPLRLWQGSTWVYGQPGTWAGFWTQFTGNEVTGSLIRWPQTAQAWVDNFAYLNEHLTRQLPWGVIGLGFLGLLWLTRERLTWAVAFLYETAAILVFVLLFPRAVWTPAVLMPALLWLTLGITYLLHRLAEMKLSFDSLEIRLVEVLPFWKGSTSADLKSYIWMNPLRLAGWLGMLLLALFLAQTNWLFIQKLTHDPSGQEMISLLQTVPIEPDKETVVALPWGTSYFAAAYGQRVTNELPGLKLVDHRANFRAILVEEGRILTPNLFLEYWPPAWWQQRVGKVYFSMAAPDVVAIDNSMSYQNVPLETDFALGNDIRIRSAAVTRQDDTLQLTIYWEATEPIAQNYSVAVHLVRLYPLQSPDDLLAQADAVHPVAGWYPTMQWSVGEVVLDQYKLTIPQGKEATALAVTMYSVDETGQFINNEWYVIPLDD